MTSAIAMRNSCQALRTLRIDYLPSATAPKTSHQNFFRSIPQTPSYSTQTATQTQPDLPPLAYHIYRTPSQELPVYHLTKRGGNLLQTQIRKIEGDRESLRDELQRFLGLAPKNISINRTTGHIIIKGRHKDAVKRFFEERSF